jgi:hypothetical protein
LSQRSIQRAVLAAILASALTIAAAYGSAFLPGGAPGWAPWAFVLGIACLLVAVMTLGALRPGKRMGPIVVPFALIWLILVGGFAAVLLLPPDPPGGALLFGLPTRAAIVLYGIGLLPVLILPLVYALTFDAVTLNEADLERVREAGRAWKAMKSESEGGTGSA